MISIAYAIGSNSDTAVATKGGDALGFIVMTVILLAMFYFLIIRPRRKKGELVMPKPANKHLPKKHSPFMRAVIIWLLILIAGLMLQSFILINVVTNVKTTGMDDNIFVVLVGLSYLIVIILSFWGAYKVYRKYDSLNKEVLPILLCIN